MQDALEHLKNQNPHIRMAQERQLLAQKAEHDLDLRFLPKIQPIGIHYDAIQDKTTLDAKSDWALPTGGNLQLHYQQVYQDDPKLRVSLEQPITHNIRSSQDEIKRLSAQTTQLQAQAHYETLILKMRKLYYQCTLDQMILDHQKDKISDIQQAIERYQILLEGGEISKLEFEKALLQYEKISLEYLKQEELAALHLSDLKQLLGLPQNKSIVLDTQLITECQPERWEVVYQKAQFFDTRYRISEHQYLKAKHAHAMAMSQRNPKLSVYAATNEKKDLNAGVRLQIAVPDSDTDYQNTKIALDYHHAQQEFEDQKGQLEHRVKTLLSEIEHQKRWLTLSEKQLALQQSIYNAEVIKSKHLQISPEDLQKASLELQGVYQTHLQHKIKLSHLRDQLLQITGEFSTLTQPERSHV